MSSVNQMTCFHLLTEVNNVLNFKTSETLKEILTRNESTSRMDTRSRNIGLLKIPMRVSKGNDFTVSATKIWNELILANPTDFEGNDIKEVIHCTNASTASKSHKAKLSDMFKKWIQEAVIGT